ncbi:MAG TPA: hypothetical protein VG184_06185 [Acidimicrobiales bacterium]|jgi:hypothetical protein|nr:hypothetical protein [Acidimicrobiales bacterium]
MSEREETKEPADALEVIGVQNKTLGELFAAWGDATDELKQGDSVDTRWERGSADKLILQHLAVRESAKEVVAKRLAEAGHAELGRKLEGDGPGRRKAISRLDELTRGLEAINLNRPDIDEVIKEVGGIFEAESQAESQEVLPSIREALGPATARDLPSARHVRTHSPTHPNPVPRWYDKVGPLKAVRALYDHLRGTPHGGTTPDVDSPREHTPGVRP